MSFYFFGLLFYIPFLIAVRAYRQAVTGRTYRKKVKSWGQLLRSGACITHYADDSLEYSYFDRNAGIERKVTNILDIIVFRRDVEMIRRLGILPRRSYYDEDHSEIVETSSFLRRLQAYGKPPHAGRVPFYYWKESYLLGTMRVEETALHIVV